VTDRVCMSCKIEICWCCNLFQKLCKKKIANRKAAFIQQNNAVDRKRNENSVSCVGKLNFTVW